MDVRHVDHVNLRIPEDGVERALTFYRDRLDFPIEGLEAYRADERSFFDVRLAPEHVVHLWPSAAFEAPTGNAYDHLALVVDSDVESVRSRLEAAGVEIDREVAAPLGATGRAPAVYVSDPFGYGIELKAGER